MVTVPQFEEAAGRLVPSGYHDRVGAALIVGVGLSSFLFHLTAVLQEPVGPVTLLFGALAPLVLSVLLVLGGVWLSGMGYDGLGLRVGAWCLVGVGLLAGMALITVQFQMARDVNLRNVAVVVGATATGGGVVGFLIGIYDAERRQSERRIAMERERAARLGRRLSVLNRVLRHDIRNDVTVIHGNAERIIDGSGGENAARAIKQKATKLHRLSESAREIESLLEREDFPTEPVDIAGILKAERWSLAHYADVDIETSIPEQIWASANPKIETAIGNVIENAVEHNDSDAPRVEIEAGIDGRHVELRVADNGPGLPEEEIRVLERGHETDVEHTSGLGLWLANWIVTESGGEIAFECGEPRGSVVTIRLPRATGTA